MSMKNADKPAYPLEAHGLDTGRTVEYHGKQDGLTKRERFAMAAMQGLLAGGAGDSLYKEQVSEMSVSQADALLKELEQTQ